jgi:hypothetical protein
VPVTLTVTVRVTDAGGASATDDATVSVLYRFDGFYQPWTTRRPTPAIADGIQETSTAGASSLVLRPRSHGAADLADRRLMPPPDEEEHEMTSTTRSTTRRIGSMALAALMIGGLTATVPAVSATAKDGDGRVIRTGDCSGRTDWKIKAKPDDGRIEVEWEVDQNRNGQVWTWTIRHDGSTVASGRRTTSAPSGSFSVERRIVDAQGQHRVSATARNVRTGEVCRASVRI